MLCYDCDLMGFSFFFLTEGQRLGARGPDRSVAPAEESPPAGAQRGLGRAVGASRGPGRLLSISRRPTRVQTTNPQPDPVAVFART